MGVRAFGRGRWLAAIAFLAMPSALAGAGSAAAQDWTNPDALSVSPDGDHLYVTGYPFTLALARDRASGELSLVGQYRGGTGPLEVSPDGRSVYTASAGPFPGDPMSPPVTAFARDARTGALSNVPVEGSPPGFGAVRGLAVSPDGLHVYASGSYNDGELALFDRDPVTGVLRFRQKLTPIAGFSGSEGLAISDDGAWLYVAGRTAEPQPDGVWPNAIAALRRTPLGDVLLDDIVTGGSGTDTVVVAPDGSWLHAGPFGPLSWPRDPATGSLGEAKWSSLVTAGGDEPGGAGMVAIDHWLYIADLAPEQIDQARVGPDGLVLERSYRERQDGAKGIEKLRSIALSPDGEHLYAAAEKGPHGPTGTVATYARDDASGQLSFVSLFVGPKAYSPLSIIIDGGAQFTNDRKVQVGPGGEVGPELQLSNDAGFGSAQTFPFRPGPYPWELEGGGPGGVPKTVYARTGSPGAWGAVASASIVLDEGSPVVTRARRSRSRPRSVRVRARDGVSGVKRVQLASRKRSPGRWRPYSPNRLYRAGRGRLFVRVLDGAGNRSRWQAVKSTRR